MAAAVSGTMATTAVVMAAVMTVAVIAAMMIAAAVTKMATAMAAVVAMATAMAAVAAMATAKATAMATVMAARAIVMAAVVAMATAMATVMAAVAAAVTAMVTGMAAARMAQQSTKRRRQRRQRWLQMRNQWRVVGGSSLRKSVEEIDHKLYLVVCSLSSIGYYFRLLPSPPKYHSFAKTFMRDSTSRVTPCYRSYICRNIYMDLGAITVPKTLRQFCMYEFIYMNLYS
jgi:hypothetical protein